MIAGFFKQSNPIVYITLGFLLSLLYLVELLQLNVISQDWLSIILIILKYLSLLTCFFAFSWALKYFQIQKYHSFAALFFVLFSSFIMPEIVETHLIFGLLLLEFGLVRLLFVVKKTIPTLYIFEATLLIVLSGLIYQPFMYLLLLIFAGTLIFLSPQWKLFTSPVLAISAVVVLVQMYHLIWFDTIVYIDFFLSQPKFSFDFSFDSNTVFLASIWGISMLLSVYEILKVKQKRALFYKEMASFFLSFLGLSLIAFGFTNATASELWVLSLWPLSIYIAEFFTKIKSLLWSEIMFWSFVGLAIAFAFI